MIKKGFSLLMIFMIVCVFMLSACGSDEKPDENITTQSIDEKDVENTPKEPIDDLIAEMDKETEEDTEKKEKAKNDESEKSTEKPRREKITEPEPEIVDEVMPEEAPAEPETPPAERSEPTEEYTTYSDPDYNLSLRHPGNWKILDKSTTQDAANNAPVNTENMGIAPNLLKNINVHWYDASSDSGASFIPNANLSVVEGTGITHDMIISDQFVNIYKSMTAEQYSLMFDDFNMLEELHVEKIGDNNFLVLKFSYTMGAEISNYQAVTAYGDNLYVFSFLTNQDSFDESIPLYNDMLSSVSFTQ